MEEFTNKNDTDELFYILREVRREFNQNLISPSQYVGEINRSFPLSNNVPDIRMGKKGGNSGQRGINPLLLVTLPPLKKLIFPKVGNSLILCNIINDMSAKSGILGV